MSQDSEIQTMPVTGTQTDFMRSTIQDLFEVVEDTFNNGGSIRPISFFPRAELILTDSGLKLSLELPGMSEEDVKVTVQDRTMIIEGEKVEETKSSDEATFQTERRYGSFYRMFTAPFPIDPERLTAKFDRGILTLEIPKPANFSDEAREIPIRH